MPKPTIKLDPILTEFLDPLRIADASNDPDVAFNGSDLWGIALQFAVYWLTHVKESGRSLDDALRPFGLTSSGLTWKTAAPAIQSAWVGMYLANVSMEGLQMN